MLSDYFKNEQQKFLAQDLTNSGKIVDINVIIINIEFKTQVVCCTVPNTCRICYTSNQRLEDIRVWN